METNPLTSTQRKVAAFLLRYGRDLATKCYYEELELDKILTNEQERHSFMQAYFQWDIDAGPGEHENIDHVSDGSLMLCMASVLDPTVSPYQVYPPAATVDAEENL